MRSMDTKITCCFTGHRPKSLPFGYDEQNPQCIRMRFLIWNLLNKLITEKGVTHFISGMALGIDQICAEVVLELKARHPEITLEQCDKETMLQHHYDKDCMQKRNRYMVDSSDIIIAVWNGKPSGTGNTIRYAQEQEKTVIVIDPQTLETKII